MEKIKKTQAAIDDVKDKLQENIMAINERGERLEDLQTKSGELNCLAEHLGTKC